MNALKAIRKGSRARRQLEAALERPHPNQLGETYRRRLRAIEAMAVERVATSAKGSLFQMMLTASLVQERVADVDVAPIQQAALRRLDSTVQSLTYSAVDALMVEHQDADLLLLREHYLPRSWNVQSACDAIAKRQAFDLQ